MNTPIFFSPWHSCLYGVGAIQSAIADHRESSAMLADVVTIIKSWKFNHSFEKVSPYSSDNLGVGIVPELLDEYFFKGGQMLRPSILTHIDETDSISKVQLFQLIKRLNDSGDPILDNLKDRDIYELLMSFAFYLKVVSNNSLLYSDAIFPSVQFIASALSRIENPFFYSRACGLLGSQFSGVSQLLPKQEFDDLLDVVRSTAQRFIAESSILLDRQHDGVHGPEDYMVFSCSILGYGLWSLEYPGLNKNSVELNDLYALATHQYENVMSVESKMSQYLFYRTFSTCFDGQISLSDDEYFEFTKTYLLQDQTHNPYDYLRVTYMLFQLGKRPDLTFDIYQAMVSKIIVRLERTCENISYSRETNKKYDNDVLSFCYSFTLWHYLDDSDLGVKVVETFEHLKRNIHKLSEHDLQKIYLAMTNVRNYQ